MRFVKNYKVLILVCYFLVALIFIVFYVDYQVVFDVKILLCFALYSLLSVVTGCRYYNLISTLTDENLEPGFVFKVPAAMNLAGLLFPVKGGGLWLVVYIKNRYGLGVLRTVVLSFVNVILLVSLGVPFGLHFLGGLSISGVSGLAFFILSYSLIVMIFMGVWFRAKSFPISRIIRFGFVDIVLTLSYLLILLLMARVVVPSQELLVYLSIVVLVLMSSLLKVTPGNIGVFEGLALGAYALMPDSGEVFPQFVAVYRLLSLMHAGLFGLPSMMSIWGPKQLKDLWLKSIANVSPKE